MAWLRIDRGSGIETPISEPDVRKRISDVYFDVDIAIDAAREHGQPIRTLGAFYRYVDVDGEAGS